MSANEYKHFANNWDTQNAFDSVRREVAEKKDFDFVKNLILDFGFTDDQAAKAATVSVDFVRKVRSALQNQK